jgi:hypothetical protein
MASIVALCAFDGPIRWCCVLGLGRPTTARHLQPGDIATIENLGSHKLVEICRAVRAIRTTLRYLPPSSPKLNPSSSPSLVKDWMRMAQTLDTAQSKREGRYNYLLRLAATVAP